MPVSSSTEHWIRPDALSINLNHFGDPDYLQVSVLAGAVVMAFKQDVIGYNAAHNYRTWPLDAANTYLETTSAYNVYARLTRSEVNARALVIYDTVLRDIEGREISYAVDEETGETVEVLGDANPDSFFMYLGQISASVNEYGEVVSRYWEIDFRAGNLGTNQYQNTEGGGDWKKLFRLNKVTDTIDVFKTFTAAIFKKILIKNKETEKVITDIKRSVDSDNEFLKDENGDIIKDEDGNSLKDPEYVPFSDETIPTSAYLVKYGKEKHLSKTEEDTAKEKITFEKGVEVGSDKGGKGITYDKETKKATAIIDELKRLLLLQSDEFLQGELGSGFILKYDKEKKRSYFEIDEILVRKIAYFVSLVIKDLKHVGGSLILSPASMTCSKVEVYDTYYRCFFEQNDGEKTINNEFVAGDLARSQTFNIKEGTSENVSNTYYWRYVVNVGDNFIDLSITDCDSGSGIPKKGDEIVQLGNRYDESRQNAIILSTVGEDAPSIKQYKGIKYYFLSDDNAVTIFSPRGNVIKGNFISASTGKNLDEELKKLQVDWDSVLDQTDKEFTMWFYPYAPTLDNLPASEWTSEELRELHDQDLFFENSTGGETSGKAYRFEKNEEGNWVWNIVNDAETIKALENAAFANKRLNDIVADNILSSLEKKEVLKEWNSLNASFAENINAASDFSLTVENSYLSGYINAYNALATYMNGGVSLSGSIPSWLADLSTNQEIDGDEYRSKWTNYYRAESELLNYLSIIAKDKADDAQNSADEAKNSINEIVSDGILSSLEKKEVLREWEEISSAYSLNLSNANENNVDTSLYASAYKALGTYLNGGVELNSGIPSWLADLSSNQEIDSATYRSKWVDYYDAEIALLEAISNAIKQKAEDAQNAANDAQQEAESKKRVFVSQPTTDSQYDVGDLWVNATYTDGVITYSNEEMVCVTAKSKGEVFSINHWRPSNGYSAGISSINGQLDLWSKSFNNDGTINETKLKLSNALAALSTRVGGTEASLKLKVEENDVKGLISSATITADQITFEGTDVKISAENIDFIGKTVINEKFIVSDDGSVIMIDFVAVDGVFTGSISSSKGSIGKFTINEYGLTTSDESAYLAFDFSGTEFLRINKDSEAFIYGRSDNNTILKTMTYGSGIAAHFWCNHTNGYALKTEGRVLMTANAGGGVRIDGGCTFTSYYELRYNPSSSYYATMAIDAPGRLRFSSQAWLLEANANDGEMYVDGDGYMKVKNPVRM